MSNADRFATSRRWTYQRKASVASAVATGALSGPEACSLHNLTHAELDEWLIALGTGGPKALKVRA